MRRSYCSRAPRPSGEYAMSWIPNSLQIALVCICCGPLLMSENCTCARHIGTSGHHRLTSVKGHCA